MTESEARAIAEAQREACAVPADWAIAHAERRIIELLEAPPPDARVRDAVVWILRFESGLGWLELAVDEKTRTVVRVERGRA